MSKIVTTKQQYSMLLELLQQKPEMAQGFTKCPKEEAVAFWESVMETLNSIGPPTKDLTSWKKVWLDWKAYVKRKLAENKKEQAATGGGRNRLHHFTEMEEAVIRLAGLNTSTYGIPNTASVGLPVETSNGNEMEVDLPMPSVSNSPAPPRRTATVQRPADTSAAELLKEQLTQQKDFQEKIIQHFSRQHEKLDDLCSEMRCLRSMSEKNYALKIAELEETRRHNKAMEDLVAIKNSIKEQMLKVEEKSLNAISKRN